MSAPGTVHVVGAGLAGLAAAIALAETGRRVMLYESGQHAGGRCRSFIDGELGCRIDNGNHLLLSGNRAALSYLERIGALATLTGPGEAAIPFVDVDTGERWVVRPNTGRVPWWVWRPARRVPGTRAHDYFAALRLGCAAESATVAEILDPNAVLFRRLWQPLAVAALNTGVEDASARLFWRVVADTLGRGAGSCIPLVARDGLSESLIEPALAWLRASGAEIRLGARLRALSFAGERVGDLLFDGDGVALGAQDDAVLAVPAPVAARLVPGLATPDDHAPIVNAHYRVAAPPGAPSILGIIGGTAQWVFRKQAIVSVTVSAADGIVDRRADDLALVLWRDVAAAYGIAAEPMPPARIVKERRATFRASPAQIKRRPATRTRWANLLLAGDYVDTGLPATIEGAIRSGFAAAAAIESRRGRRLVERRDAGSAPRAVAPSSRDRHRALP